MSFKTYAIAAVAALSFAMPAWAESAITVHDAYARVATKVSKSGAAFMVIENASDTADQLIGVKSDIAKRVQLHTHVDDGNGTMQMRHVEEGFVIPANGTHQLGRGGDHVMFMGLTQGLKHGDVVSFTLVFENAGEVSLDVPVDLERTPEQSADHMSHGDHGAMSKDGEAASN